MTPKERHRLKMLEYLSDPENEFIDRKQLAVSVIGYKNHKSLYVHFTPAELMELEGEAVIERKRRSAQRRVRVLEAVYRRAVGMSVPDSHVSVIGGEVVITPMVKHLPPETAAAKEWLDRVEGKLTDKVAIGVTLHEDKIEDLE